MHRFLQRAFWTLARWLLRLRYRVEVTGLEALAELEGPTLVMPNHPGYIDPPLVLSHVRLRGPIRPMVYGGTYRNPVLHPIMRLVDSLEVPDLAEQSQSAPSGPSRRSTRSSPGFSAARASWSIPPAASSEATGR